MQAETNRKAKKSDTLAPESGVFLKMMQEKRQTESVSRFWRRFYRTFRREHERASVERAVANYYSSLADSEVEEHARWGELALTQFPNAKRG